MASVFFVFSTLPPKIMHPSGFDVFPPVMLFLETDDFARDYKRMVANGVSFIEEPRHEPYGSVAVFVDLYGNKWDLIEPRR